MNGVFLVTAKDNIMQRRRKFAVYIEVEAWQVSMLANDPINNIPIPEMAWSNESETPISDAIAQIESLGYTVIKIGDY